MAAAVDWTGATNGVMKQIGKCFKYMNSEKTRADTTIPGELDATADLFEAGSADNRRIVTNLLSSLHVDKQRACLEAIKGYGRAVETRLLDRTTVLNPLLVDQPVIDTVLHQAVEDLYGNDTVKRSVFAIGSVTAGSGNTGNGSVVLDSTLDAVSAPCQRLRAHRKNSGLASEMLIPETMRIVCVVDSNGQILPPFGGAYRGRLLQPNFIIGNEQYYICGKTPSALRVSTTARWGTGYGMDTNDGSGPGPIFYPVDSDLGTPETQIIANSGFESFTTANEPDNWQDSNSGAAGTRVLKSTSEKYTGSSSLQFNGDATTTIRRQQLLNTQYLVGGKKYYISAWLKWDTGIAAGSFVIQFVGTGYTAASGEKINPTLTSGGGTWTHFGAHVILPAALPSDWSIKCEASNTLTNNKNIYIDNVHVQEETWHGGLSVVAYSGSTPPAIGDYWTAAITQSTTGVAQESFKKWFGIQLPSVGGGSNTIDEAWFT